LKELHRKLKLLPACALFRIAVEETESWFIADQEAIKQAYPKAKILLLARVAPDDVIGAWELLAKTFGRKTGSKADKTEWAAEIAPYLDLDDPKSSSLKAFITGIAKLMSETNTNSES
jgi:hypothetical protein